MRSGRCRWAPVAGVLLAVAAVASAPAARAEPKPWNGRYEMTTYASQKVGTSPAAHQREDDVSGVFTLTTACTFDHCTATVVDGPPPANPTVPTPIRYLWNGTGWVDSYDWMWNCSLGGNQPAHATSFALYAPQPDGSLRGTWHTDISDGPCRGSVVMPVSAVPV